METTTILHLPTEILLQILVLADLSQRQLLELASVSARFNTVAISTFLSSFSIHDPKGTCTVPLGFVHDDLKLDALSGLLMSVDIRSIETLICILPNQRWGRDEVMIQLLRLNSFLYQLSYLKKLVLRFHDDPTYADIRAINDFAQLFGIIVTTITSKGCKELILRNYATEKLLKNGSKPPSETNLYNPSQLSSLGGRRDQCHWKSTSGGGFGGWISSLFKKKPHVTHVNMQHEIQPWIVPYNNLHIRNSIRTLRIEASAPLFDPCFVHTAQILPDIVSFGLENISLSLSDFSSRLLALKIAFFKKDGDGPSSCFIPHNIPSDFLPTPFLRTNNILEHLFIRRCEKISATILLPFIECFGSLTKLVLDRSCEYLHSHEPHPQLRFPRLEILEAPLDYVSWFLDLPSLSLPSEDTAEEDQLHLATTTLGSDIRLPHLQKLLIYTRTLQTSSFGYVAFAPLLNRIFRVLQERQHSIDISMDLKFHPDNALWMEADVPMFHALHTYRAPILESVSCEVNSAWACVTTIYISSIHPCPRSVVILSQASLLVWISTLFPGVKEVVLSDARALSLPLRDDEIGRDAVETLKNAGIILTVKSSNSNTEKYLVRPIL